MYSKDLVIRADASSKMGMGHVMRCLALAQAWQDRGGNAIFLSRCESRELRNRISEEGFEYIHCERPFPDKEDLNLTLGQLTARKAGSVADGWLVIDGYQFDSGYQRAVRQGGFRVVVIDDMAHLDHYEADVLVNQNIFAENLPYRTGSETQLLLGCEYALIRREFQAAGTRKKALFENGKKVLVTLGGSDSGDLTSKIVEALEKVNVPGLQAKIIVGPGNTGLGGTGRRGRPFPTHIEINENVRNMPDLMAWADVAVSSAGSTFLELAFMGIPNLLIVLEENQRMVAEECERKGLSVNLGWHHHLTPDRIARELEAMLYDRERLAAVSRKARKLVDGTGANRVIDRVWGCGHRAAGDGL